MPAASTYHASDGAAYELFLGRWTKVLAPPLLDFAELPSDAPLLDVGTDTGSLAFAMARRWPTRQIIGIDIADSYIAYARSLAAGPSPAFETGDVSALRFQDNAFSGSAASHRNNCSTMVGCNLHAEEPHLEPGRRAIYRTCATIRSRCG